MTKINQTSVREIRRERAHDGFFKVERITLSHDKFDGTPTGEIVREVFERGTAVAVLPYDPELDRVLLIRQFLVGAHVAGHPNRPVQVVAGMVEPGEEPIDVARREAMEEANCEIGWVKAAQAFMPSPGGSSERLETFVAQASLSGPLGSGGIYGLAEENEDIQVIVLSAQEAIDMLDRGDIEAGPAVVLLSWFARHRKALRQDALASQL